jgi:hypothetical protein
VRRLASDLEGAPDAPPWSSLIAGGALRGAERAPDRFVSVLGEVTAEGRMI